MNSIALKDKSFLELQRHSGTNIGADIDIFQEIQRSRPEAGVMT
jgi:hypothetical protein